MGVDAEFIVKGVVINDLALRRTSANMVAAFYSDCFLVNEEEDKHAIVREEDYLRVRCMWRFYGPGYARGPWPQIRALILWLRHNFQTDQVYYGGDCSPIEEYYLADDDCLKAIDKIFNESGHDTYQYAFGRAGICKFCGDRPMTQFRWGPNTAGYRCSGCGKEIEITIDKEGQNASA